VRLDHRSLGAGVTTGAIGTIGVGGGGGGGGGQLSSLYASAGADAGRASRSTMPSGPQNAFARTTWSPVSASGTCSVPERPPFWFSVKLPLAAGGHHARKG